MRFERRKGSSLPDDDQFTKELSAMESMEVMKEAIIDTADEKIHEAKELLAKAVDHGIQPQQLVRTGLVVNAWHMRMMMGDPHPASKPIGRMSTTVLATNRNTGEFVEIPDEEFAIAMISHAANWDWSEVDSSMQARLDQAEREKDPGFLMRLTGTLIEIFVALDGPRRVGWIE